MSTIRYIHWNAEEAEEAAKRIRSWNHDVLCDVPDSGQFIKKIESQRPDLIIINLNRLPAQGRDFAFMIRARKSTRFIPILFLEGQPDKAASIRDRLPDAVYTTWDRLAIDIERALAEGVSNPFVPASMMDAYKGKPLAEKLGIKDNFIVALIDSPENYPEMIDPLPNKVTFFKAPVSHCDLIIWFIRDAASFVQRIDQLLNATDCRKIWIAWPKRSSSFQSDLSQNLVRKTALAAGLVDYKISSFDDTWSGLLFKVRTL
ncbi:hypothetical protein JXB12_08340 [candidate division KSB1 bacterium]|nr:hypothetical protein [candidate division KSB1 bacterium]